MFGALNRFISRLDADAPPQQADSGVAHNAFGFQVLRNSNNELPVEPWFDFIIGINGRNIDNPDPNLLQQEIRNLGGNSVNLGLWSAKGQRLRSIYAPVPSDASSLGLSLQWTQLATAENLWHILDIAPNSPADLAGLLPFGDYIIGSPEGLLRGESGLGELVEDFLTRPLRLYVYNHDYNVTRLVTIQPSRSWGGAGALGCTLGYGALHRIPVPLDEPPQAPGETMFEAARLSTDGEPGPEQSAPVPTSAPQYLVPAEMETMPSAPPMGGPPMGGAKRPRPQHHGAKSDMDAFFAEGEAKSKEQGGYSSSPKPASGGIAPPPKNGPPRAGTPLKQDDPAEEQSNDAT
ncbi:MAG: hypothetical protein Q9159_004425 [Coniocarpon cinnabarinum]